MSASDFDNVETRLTVSLQEYKNPIVIFCFGIVGGLVFYFKSLNVYYLLALCLVIFLFLIFIAPERKTRELAPEDLSE